MSIKRLWRPVAALVILVATIAAFTVYFISHPELRHQLDHTSPTLLLLLLALYAAFVGSLSLINSAALRLCKTKIPASESLLLTMYSSVINFFGPLQSGPAFRALYLKQRHAVKLKDYASASLVYYFFYALISGLLMLAGVIKWWLIPGFVGLALAAWYLQRHPVGWLRGLQQLNLRNWYYMAGATLVQISLLLIIFYIELRSVAPGIDFSQVLIYTGTANLALFVSITPGAIGFRESFLLFTQRLHHIDSSTILAANLIDRSVYIMILLLSALIIFATHANRRLRLRT